MVLYKIYLLIYTNRQTIYNLLQTANLSKPSYLVFLFPKLLCFHLNLKLYIKYISAIRMQPDRRLTVNATIKLKFDAYTYVGK